MSISYALLLDGAFVRHKLGSARFPVDAARINAFLLQFTVLPCLAAMRLHRVYFYDAKPLEGISKIPLSGKSIDFGIQRVATTNKSIQAVLAREPFVALRFGELSHEGWRLKKDVWKKTGPKIQIDAEDIEPHIVQKGVDMRIGLDIASLTLKQQVQVIVLVTGDSDFIPAMKFARREGAQLFLLTLGHSIKEGMREHADLVIDKMPA